MTQEEGLSENEDNLDDPKEKPINEGLQQY